MRRALLLLTLLPLLLAAAPVHAQDVRALVDRIDRLQRDLDTMQRQVYRGQAPQGPIGAPPQVVPYQGSGEGLNNAAVARFDARISQMESALRDLTGKLEEISYANEQTRRELEKLSGDVDVRFQQLESRPQAQAQAAGQPPPPAASRRRLRSRGRRNRPSRRRRPRRGTSGP